MSIARRLHGRPGQGGSTFPEKSGLIGNADDQASTTANLSSELETTSPLTEQVATAFPILRRKERISASMKRVSPGTTGLRNLTLSAERK